VNHRDVERKWRLWAIPQACLFECRFSPHKLFPKKKLFFFCGVELGVARRERIRTGPSCLLLTEGARGFKTIFSFIFRGQLRFFPALPTVSAVAALFSLSFFFSLFLSSGVVPCYLLLAWRWEWSETGAVRLPFSFFFLNRPSQRGKSLSP